MVLSIALPLILGIKDTMLFAIVFCSVWFIYATALFATTFLIAGKKNLKKRLKEGTNDNGGFLSDECRNLSLWRSPIDQRFLPETLIFNLCLSIQYFE